MKIWIPSNKAIELLGISRQAFHKARRCGKYQYREVPGNGDGFEILLSSLPQNVQTAYIKSKTDAGADAISDAEMYASAPEHARRKADKYLAILQLAMEMTGSELRECVAAWNRSYPQKATSYASVTRVRNEYKLHGMAALLGRWGKRSGSSAVGDDLFSFFKSCYLTEGRASAVTCWKMTLGYAAEHCIDTSAVPSHTAFMRRIEKEVPEQAVYAARYGSSAANRKFGFYIKRDMSDILAGECWVSDHAQIDVAVFYRDIRGKEKVGFPWVTVKRDYKSGYWAGYDLYMGGPSSDNIFMAFYRAAAKWGVPNCLYLDNGKDFRCRQFSGGRTKHRLDMDEVKTTALTAALGISTIFAWPYNAQAKVVERDFNRNKEWFSRLSDGYRGGDVVERPEHLNDKIAQRKIITFDEFAGLWNRFVNDVIMKTPLTSGYRAGRCPDEIWNEEYPAALERGLVRRYTKDALKLFCCKTSSIRQIDRRGFHDAELGVDYYDAWMEGQKGRKVYLRRDPQAMQEAWVFDAITHDYIGQARFLPETPGLARTDVQLADLRGAIAMKRNAEKVVRTLSKPDVEVPFDYKIALMTNATRVLNDRRGYTEKPIDPEAKNINLTDMDLAVAKHKRLQAEGTQDISGMPMPPEEKKMYAWEWEKEEARQANG